MTAPNIYIVDPVEFPIQRLLFQTSFRRLRSTFIESSPAAAAAASTVAAASTAAHMFAFFGIFYIFVDYVCTISKDQSHDNNICQHFTHPLFKYCQSYKVKTEAGHINCIQPLSYFIISYACTERLE